MDRQNETAVSVKIMFHCFGPSFEDVNEPYSIKVSVLHLFFKAI